MNNCFIILAAGKGKRFNSKVPKAYYLYKGKPLIQHSIDKVKNYKKINKIVIVINKKHKKFLNKINVKNTKIIESGKTRAESTFKL
jgi:4-diphosphocytidyl-2-methyl-D-erithritol synthase